MFCNNIISLRLNLIADQTMKTKDCPGTVTETTRPHFHIFIDLDTRTLRKKHGLKCKLADVPVILTFVKQYRYI